MFHRTGIGLDDLEWIHRDQFVYYVELANTLNISHDWPLLRRHLLDALIAAFGLNDEDQDDSRNPTPPQRRTLAVLDKIRDQHDPATDWHSFLDALWKQRHTIRPDLP